jgi:hypothetical protein
MEGVVVRASYILYRWLRAIGLAPAQLKPSDHFFRHIGKARIDGDFVDPAAFRLRTKDDGQIEKGLSINWVEYFQKPTPEDSIAALMKILLKKGRKVGGESRFALLNVGEAKNAAAKYTTVAVVFDEEKDDPSHALVTGYEKYNDQVAEELAKVIINKFSPNPSK